LIDTPGFGDTGNVQNNQNVFEEKDLKDKEIFLKKFGTFFERDFEKKCGGSLTSACFIVKASENRYNEFQQKIIERVTQIFATDVKENFLSIFTHADTFNPDSKQLMTKLEIFKEKEEKKEKWYWSLSSSKYFEEIINSNDGNLTEDEIKIQKDSQILGYKNVIAQLLNFVKTIINLKSLDITLTKKNMALNKSLQITVKSIKEDNLKRLLKQYENIQNYKAQLDEKIFDLKEKEQELASIKNSIVENQNKKDEVSKDIHGAKAEVLELNKNKIKNDAIKNELNKELLMIQSKISSFEEQKKKLRKRKKSIGRKKIESGK